MIMHEHPFPLSPDQQWADDHIERFVDGELTGADRDRFVALLADEPWLRSQVAAARRIHEELASIPLAVCPESVTRNVLAHARADWWIALPRRLAEGFRRMADAGLRPALAMALLLIVVLSSTLVSRPDAPPAVASAEVTQALADVKLALGVLADAGRTTGNAVSQDVIGPLVVRPVARGLQPLSQN